MVPLTQFAAVDHRRLSGCWFPKEPTSGWELILASYEADERITVLRSSRLRSRGSRILVTGAKRLIVRVPTQPDPVIESLPRIRDLVPNGP